MGVFLENKIQEIKSAQRPNSNHSFALGFTINLQKSVLHPIQNIECLGFILDSQLMTLSQKQIDKIVSVCTKLLQAHTHQNKFVTSVIDMLTLLYRAIDHDKMLSYIYRNNSDFHKVNEDEINWWKDNIVHNFTHPPLIVLTISLEDWGATAFKSLVDDTWEEDLAFSCINSLDSVEIYHSCDPVVCMYHQAAIQRHSFG